MESYFENSSVSQSKLKSLLIHPMAWSDDVSSELYFEEKKYFIIGAAVDYCLTQSSETFNDVYHISEVENKPSDTVKSILKEVFDSLLSEFNIEDIGLITDVMYRPIISQCCERHNYQPRYNEATKVNKICEHYEYWEDLKAAYGKIILSAKESDLIAEIIMSLRTNEATAVYFNAEKIEYQVPIYFEYEGVPCKALLDMIVIDEEAKTVQPIDIKTMGDYTIKFPKSLRMRRYDIQAAFYTEALKSYLPGYEILPFKFIVESTIAPGEPLVFTVHPSLLYIGKYGRPETFINHHIYSNNSSYGVRQEEIKGFSQLIELYKYYSTKGWEKDQIVQDSQSELTIDWSGIII